MYLFRFTLAFFNLYAYSIYIFIPYTRRYNNTDYVWIRKVFLFTLSLNTLVYILVLTFENPIIRSLLLLRKCGMQPLYSLYGTVCTLIPVVSETVIQKRKSHLPLYRIIHQK